jgi:hypothetical protein
MRKRKYGILSLNVFSTGISWSYSVKDRVGAVGQVDIDFRDRSYQKLIFAREFIAKVIQEYKPSHVILSENFNKIKHSMLKMIYGVMGIIIDRCFSHTLSRPTIVNPNIIMDYYGVNTLGELYDFMIDIYGWEDKKMSYETHKDIINSIAQSVYYFEKILGGHGKKVNRNEYKDTEPLYNKFIYF